MQGHARSAQEELEFRLDIVACAAAEAFTDAYYAALTKNRDKISSFYAPKSADGKTPTIAWNGASYDDGAAIQAYLEGLTYMYYELESLDSNILNPISLPATELKGGSGSNDKDFERRMSLIVTASGSVRLQEREKGPVREFAETFVLVPNGELTGKATLKFEKGWQNEWLIQTQNFRFTEWGETEVENVKMEDTKGNIGGGGPGQKKDGQSQGRFGSGHARHFAAAGLAFKGKGKT